MGRADSAGKGVFCGVGKLAALGCKSAGHGCTRRSHNDPGYAKTSRDVAPAGKSKTYSLRMKKVLRGAIGGAGFALRLSTGNWGAVGSIRDRFFAVQTGRKGFDMSEIQYSSGVGQLARKSQKWRDQGLENSDGRIKAARCGGVFGTKNFVKSAV